MGLTTHELTLGDGELVLRPMTEDDWDLVLRINNEAEIAHFTEGGGDWHGYTLEEVQRIYAGISAQAFMFVMELKGRAIGECWLQRMNLPRLLDAYLGLDCRRIDLVIGEKALWGRGLGTRAIRLLARLGFGQERVDAIFGCELWDFNHRRRAFEKAGFAVASMMAAEPGAEGRCTYDLAMFREPGLAAAGKAGQAASGGLGRTVEIARAEARELDVVISILEEAAEWLQSRGIPQWLPGEFRRR